MTTGTLLDVSKLPCARAYECEDGSEIDLAEFVDKHEGVIRSLAANGLIRTNRSFGFAMVQPLWDEGLDALQAGGDFWDYPEHFTWFVHGWGPDCDELIANAVRKLRALLRPHRMKQGWNPLTVDSTLEMRFDFPGQFRDKVESRNEDGTFPWGDFPWGGAAFVHMGPLTLGGAVSGFSEIEDDMVTRLILGGLGQRIVLGHKLLKD